MVNIKGTLYIVSTPIGNLEDITFRALRILREVEIVAAEDTRRSIKIFNHFNISTKLVSYHEHNKIEKGRFLIEQLENGKNIALVCDAGTPGISDPGEDIVKFAIQKNIKITVIPGATAVIAGLVLSGMSTESFIFEGFLPKKSRKRKDKIKSLKYECRTIILYETPHRLLKILNELLEELGNREIALMRELTKKHEEVIRCFIKEAVKTFKNTSPKGEFVLVIKGADKKQIEHERRELWNEIDIENHVNMYINQGYSKMEAIKKTAKDRGRRKSEIYNDLLNKNNY